MAASPQLFITIDMNITHRIVELDNGFFTVERYVPWFFFGIEIPKWEGYGEWRKEEFDYWGGTFDTTSWKELQFGTQDKALRWMRERFGDNNVRCKSICAVLGVK
jgi:hypothetical protein